MQVQSVQAGGSYSLTVLVSITQDSAEHDRPQTALSSARDPVRLSSTQSTEH